MAAKLWRALSRKRVDDESEEKSELARVLGLFDLTALGVGATLGLGVYVLAGRVAKDVAGPAVCISFLIAALASALAGMCYAEFAARVPKAGSAYVYSYVTVGEFIAFIIGWNLILEYIIGTASIARGLSNYVDSLIDNQMRHYFRETMPMDVKYLSEYPDFFAFGVVQLLVALLSIGVRESSYLNMGFTAINLVTILIVVIAGAIKADVRNWSISPENIPADVKNPGTGGFMPFGIAGVMTGAAKCFFGFVGFDSIAATGEEAKNPQKNIPFSIIISLLIVFGAYFSISAVLTMMCPYYEQDADAPFPYVFHKIGWPVIKWIVNIGSVFALCTSLFGAMFPLPRIFYAMASDGIIFTFLAKIHEKSQTPMIGTIVSGLLIGFMTLIFNVDQLVDMMSLGTLLAYTIVAICVLILRYKESNQVDKVNTCNMFEDNSSLMDYFSRFFNIYNQKVVTKFSSNVASRGIIIFSVLVVVLGLLIQYLQLDDSPTGVFLHVIVAIIAFIAIFIVIAISRQPVNSDSLSFKVPLVPFVPCLSMCINIYLMLQLNSSTWVKFAVWMFIGLCIYFFYGMRKSIQGQRDKLIQDPKPRGYTDPIRLVTRF